ncbi:alpha/beta hydrolase [Lewinella sp. 4G2]|uniref:alpha/beta hydrolase n=1 Tax=Lewinella sp. 4G2 TaxID=1803372 RepID=UPI0007B4A8DD|nr:alpha/beta fold hydrolase [Lewinella sp. 4G2]OAV46145.1 hypothetical protein A3850_017960 [Lewinella sp. 4G2]
MLRALLYFLLSLFVLGCVAAYVVVDHVLPYAILKPRRVVNNSLPDSVGLDFEHFRLQSSSDTIELDAIFVPATVPARANLIMLHGIGSCKEVYLGTLPRLCELGYNVLLWDQRAHGKSGGTYVTYGAKEKVDVCRGIDWLENKAPDLPTGIYGNSMGGAVALQSLAFEKRLQFGLIESTFTNLPEITQAYGTRLSGYELPRWLTDRVLRRAGRVGDFKPFAIRPVDAAVDITQPVQLIHGDADSNINVSHAHLLFSALGSADKDLYLVANGDHADLWHKGGEDYEEVWYGFFRRMVAR